MDKRMGMTAVLSLLLCCLLSVSAAAMENNMLKVGVKYGSDAMFSANLQNYDETQAVGYAMGYFDQQRNFVPLGPTTAENKITVVADGNSYASGNAYYSGTGSGDKTVGGWQLQTAGYYDYYEDAADTASRYSEAFPAFVDGRWTVRLGSYTSRSDAENALALWDGETTMEVAPPSGTGVKVCVTGSNRVLFYFDWGTQQSLGVMPVSVGGKPVTWFRGYRYYGGFEYKRAAGGNITVINVVDIEDYVKGCVGWEIGNDKPLEAVKAQAVCARTYAAMQTRHRSLGFDVCTTDDCQVYQGLASANEITDRAVDETAGLYMYDNGKYAEAFYYSSNGGATEDAKNVWGTEVAYLKGKEDPYEAYIASRISNYNWSVSFTAAEIQSKLSVKGINIGTVQNVYISQFTPSGNVYALTFEGSGGKKTVYREACRTTLGLRSMRFNMGTAAPVSPGNTSVAVNTAANTFSGLRGLYAVSGNGTVQAFADDSASVITSAGTQRLGGQTAAQVSRQNTTVNGRFTFTGSGWGHNVGMSQWGACAMAEQGLSFRDILQFYYTGVTIE